MPIFLLCRYYQSVCFVDYFKKSKENNFYIDLVCKHGAAPRKIAVNCNSHHRQGISLPTDRKPRIDFEKTCSADRFWKGITRRKPAWILDSCGFLLFHFPRSTVHEIPLWCSNRASISHLFRSVCSLSVCATWKEHKINFEILLYLN